MTEILLAERSAQLADRSAQLAEKTIQLAAASARVAEMDAEIVRLKEENEKLKQDIEGLRTTSHVDNHRGGLHISQEVRAGIGEIQATLREQSRDFTPERPMPRCTLSPVRESSALQMSPLSLSATFNNSIQVPSQHADVTLVMLHRKTTLAYVNRATARWADTDACSSGPSSQRNITWPGAKPPTGMG